ncbi:ATP-dependent RNA helicase HrpA [Thauera chlorobenzoica]|uniref:RNA helicase HrpA n=1 Tax=Thauera chlorobenzoica TaxID=96773 RepID=A0A1H5W657_9RHOO|nr:ATP-dependent RNA helicase HrpA [Thauera chlorobenzoica]APR03389.1 RNA helicase HrpA [Thauera chlorobenzoica]SEF94716.1 ATP-dependent helicase HrpA [Thauera chlorobenzoica]
MRAEPQGAARPSRPPDLDDCLSADRPRLRRLARELGRGPRPGDERLARLQADYESLLARSRAAFAARRAALPVPGFPPELPVSARRDEIAAALAAHQVLIVCGETGSGKTTQLPKIALTLGRGVAGLIGHTQPRRLAARATASRIAQELASPLGQAVGYKIRFTDRIGPASYVKLMTDGILLAETQTDPLLAAYDTLIIDEAHERSLNIDFLLGYLKTLLPRRPDLKVVVTSATLDAERFARHFADAAGTPAPVIEVSGRLYPIEMRYRPVAGEEGEPVPAARGGERAAVPRKDRGRDLIDALVDAVDEAQRCGPGDVLVFLPGEREIREAAEALRKAHHLPGTEILPLFARQSAQEQARVFSPSNGRRVVLSTNVAETSLTVPGIRYVVDTGLARVKRYSPRNKVEQLQIEKIAQSAAQQRAGRCGRVMDGICLRLYDEDDFNRRPAHTDPEILRASLAGVILRMKALRLGAVEDFPFIDAPGSRLIGDGYALLAELGAVSDDDERKLTPIGVELARLPLDPRIGRMILAARDRGALAEVRVIAAALSVQDPRERPQDSPGAADQAHAKFRGGEQDQKSEFLWYWQLWKAWDEVQRHESSSKQKAWCKKHFLSYMRMREWRDVFTQLHSLCTEHGWKENTQPANYEAIHKALLAGLLGNIGCKVEDGESGGKGAQAGSYLGARGIKFWPHPGSALAKKAGKWIMAAEQVETSRLFGRCIARIEPEWMEEVGGHLIKRQVFEPHWSKSSGAVRAWERGTLYGLVIYPRRGVAYRDIDPVLCRELLIREGLVQGEIAEGPARAMAFLTHNQRLVAEIERLEHKSRRPDVLVDEALIEAFYDSKIPAEVLDLAALEAWRKPAEKAEPKLLHLSREQLMRHEAEGVTTERFPPALDVLGQKLKLVYLHQPGEADDGVTLVVPLAMLNQVPANRCEWLVPGLLEEKVAALMKTVPQKHRHRLQPVAESAAAFMAAFEAGEFDLDEPLLKTLQRFVEERVQLKLPLESFRAENLKPHGFMNFRVIDEHGRVLGQSRNLMELRTRFREQVAARFSAAKIGGVLAARSATAVAGKAGEGAPDAVAERAVADAGGSKGRGRGMREAAEGGSGDDARGAGASAGGVLSGVTAWTFGALPELLEIHVAGRDVIGFPALHDDGDSVSLRPYDTPEEAARVHRRGLARLFALRLKDQVRAVERLPGLRELALQYMSFGTEAELKARLVEATLARCCLLEPLPADAEAFARRCAEAKSRIGLVAQEFVRLAGQLVAEHLGVQKRLPALKAFPGVVADIQSQLTGLLPKDFLVAFPWERLAHFPRYLKGVSVRLDKLRNNPARDAQAMTEWKGLAQAWARERSERRRAAVDDPALEEFRWLLEELRVGLFAQELKTPMPVSVRRLQKIWESRPR